jgi:hypothetical protein
MPSASVHSGSTVHEGAWVKKWASVEAAAMSDVQPVTLPNPPKVINAYMWLWCERGFRLYKVLCHVSSTGTKFMQSWVWQVCTMSAE